MGRQGGSVSSRWRARPGPPSQPYERMLGSRVRHPRVTVGGFRRLARTRTDTRQSKCGHRHSGTGWKGSNSGLLPARTEPHVFRSPGPHTSGTGEPRGQSRPVGVEWNGNLYRHSDPEPAVLVGGLWWGSDLPGTTAMCALPVCSDVPRWTEVAECRCPWGVKRSPLQIRPARPNKTLAQQGFRSGGGALC